MRSPTRLPQGRNNAFAAKERRRLGWWGVLALRRAALRRAAGLLGLSSMPPSCTSPPLRPSWAPASWSLTAPASWAAAPPSLPPPSPPAAAAGGEKSGRAGGQGSRGAQACVATTAPSPLGMLCLAGRGLKEAAFARELPAEPPAAPRCSLLSLYAHGHILSKTQARIPCRLHAPVLRSAPGRPAAGMASGRAGCTGGSR